MYITPSARASEQRVGALRRGDGAERASEEQAGAIGTLRTHRSSAGCFGCFVLAIAPPPSARQLGAPPSLVDGGSGPPTLRQNAGLSKRLTRCARRVRKRKQY